MEQPKVRGGCILIARQIIESEIWQKPPLYMKVWIFLLTLAQHKDYKLMKRGQLRTSIPDIIEACSWKVGARTERPSKDQIYQILEWLRKPNEGGHESNAKATMITTTKATHGMLINIDNYAFYQELSNYESNGEGNDEKATKAPRKQRQPNNINKNVKNDNNEHKEITSSPNKKTAYTEESPFYQMSIYFHSKIMEHAELNQVAHLIEHPNLQTWSDDFRKIIDLDKRNPKEVKKVIDWATSDSFWAANILSPAKLRKQYITLVARISQSINQKNKNSNKNDRNKNLVQEKIKEAQNEQSGNIEADVSDDLRLPSG